MLTAARLADLPGSIRKASGFAPAVACHPMALPSCAVAPICEQASPLHLRELEAPHRADHELYSAPIS
jgi:hypothetical protein